MAVLSGRLRRDETGSGMAVLSGRLRRDETGSGMAIGVAMVFPMLMIVIVALQLMTETSRIEQTLQALANRAARTASLCCHATDSAVSVVETSLAAAENENAFNFVFCNNDFVGDSRTVFIDVGGQDVAVGADSPVPPGGTVYVFLRCRIPPQNLGGFALPGLEVDRRVVGSAAIDPFRYRAAGP